MSLDERIEEILGEGNTQTPPGPPTLTPHIPALMDMVLPQPVRLPPPPPPRRQPLARNMERPNKPDARRTTTNVSTGNVEQGCLSELLHVTLKRAAISGTAIPTAVKKFIETVAASPTSQGASQEDRREHNQNVKFGKGASCR
jgi:hypothetical protein